MRDRHHLDEEGPSASDYAWTVPVGLAMGLGMFLIWDGAFFMGFWVMILTVAMKLGLEILDEE